MELPSLGHITSHLPPEYVQRIAAAEETLPDEDRALLYEKASLANEALSEAMGADMTMLDELDDLIQKEERTVDILESDTQDEVELLDIEKELDTDSLTS